jgi:hypothetical protein
MIDTLAAALDDSRSKALIESLKHCIDVIKYDDEAVKYWMEGMSLAYFPNPADPFRSLTRSLNALFLGFSNRHNGIIGLYEELRFTPTAIGMAESLRLAESVAHSWPPAGRQALVDLRIFFQGRVESQGWEEVVVPDAPAIVRDRLTRFREAHDRPRFEALLSWVEGVGDGRISGDSQAHDIFGSFATDENIVLARSLGFKPTMTPDEARSRYPTLEKARLNVMVLRQSNPDYKHLDYVDIGKCIQILWGLATERDAVALATPRPTAEVGSTPKAGSTSPVSASTSSGEKPRQRRDRGLGMRVYGEFLHHIEAIRDGKTSDLPPTPTQLAKRIGCSPSYASRVTKRLRDSYGEAVRGGTLKGWKAPDGATDAWVEDDD